MARQDGRHRHVVMGRDLDQLVVDRCREHTLTPWRGSGTGRARRATTSRRTRRRRHVVAGAWSMEGWPHSVKSGRGGQARTVTNCLLPLSGELRYVREAS